MPQTRERIAQDVASKLIEVETRIDEAIAAASALLATMPNARLQAKVAASVGHDAMAQTADALTSLMGARRNVVSVHEDLAELRDQLGLRVVAGGDLWKLPAPNLLQVVANDRKAA
jgi:hypothetical protein